ncbi:hypothetical protein ABK040_002598 [Willaertia magna]
MSINSRVSFATETSSSPNLNSEEGERTMSINSFPTSEMVNCKTETPEETSNDNNYSIEMPLSTASSVCQLALLIQNTKCNCNPQSMLTGEAKYNYSQFYFNELQTILLQELHFAKVIVLTDEEATIENIEKAMTILGECYINSNSYKSQFLLIYSGYADKNGFLLQNGNQFLNYETFLSDFFSVVNTRKCNRNNSYSDNSLSTMSGEDIQKKSKYISNLTHKALLLIDGVTSQLDISSKFIVPPNRSFSLIGVSKIRVVSEVIGSCSFYDSFLLDFLISLLRGSHRAGYVLEKEQPSRFQKGIPARVVSQESKIIKVRPIEDIVPILLNHCSESSEVRIESTTTSVRCPHVKVYYSQKLTKSDGVYHTPFQFRIPYREGKFSK